MIEEKILETIVKAADAKTQKEKVNILKSCRGTEFTKYLQYVIDPRHNFYLTNNALDGLLWGIVDQPADFHIMINVLYDLKTRAHTGNYAIKRVNDFLSGASPTLRTLFTWALDRQLPGNIGEKLINKAFPGLIYHQPYGGVSSFDAEKIHTRFDWNSGVIIQEKVDGLSLFITKDYSGTINAFTRQGQAVGSKIIGLIHRITEQMDNGTVLHCEAMLYSGSGNTMPRIEANGKFNSLFQGNGGVNANDLRLVILDVIDYNSFYNGLDSTPCRDRYTAAIALVGRYRIRFASTHTEPMPTLLTLYSAVVDSPETAREWTQRLIAQGGEGAVIKDPRAPWKDTRMTSQMKLKNEFECSLKVISVIPHKKRKSWVGSLLCISDESGGKQIKTKVGSGLNEDTTSPLCRMDSFGWEGKIIEVRAECISKNNALQHPRIVDVRFDKNSPDTYEQVLAAYNDSISLK